MESPLPGPGRVAGIMDNYPGYFMKIEYFPKNYLFLQQVNLNFETYSKIQIVTGKF